MLVMFHFCVLFHRCSLFTGQILLSQQASHKQFVLFWRMHTNLRCLANLIITCGNTITSLMPKSCEHISLSHSFKQSSEHKSQEILKENNQTNKDMIHTSAPNSIAASVISILIGCWFPESVT